ncbi:MAG: hypothetical protein ABIK68_18330 [bacterium]
MILKIYKILSILQIAGTTFLGFLLYNLTGAIAGFTAGVLIAGHFLTVLNTRNINVENTKILKDLLEEVKKARLVQEKNPPALNESSQKEVAKK